MKKWVLIDFPFDHNLHTFGRSKNFHINNKTLVFLFGKIIGEFTSLPPRGNSARSVLMQTGAKCQAVEPGRSQFWIEFSLHGDHQAIFQESSRSLGLYPVLNSCDDDREDDHSKDA